jgi:hypothetical protein
MVKVRGGRNLPRSRQRKSDVAHACPPDPPIDHPRCISYLLASTLMYREYREKRDRVMVSAEVKTTVLTSEVT